MTLRTAFSTRFRSNSRIPDGKFDSSRPSVSRPDRGYVCGQNAKIAVDVCEILKSSRAQSAERRLRNPAIAGRAAGCFAAKFVARSTCVSNRRGINRHSPASRFAAGLRASSQARNGLGKISQSFRKRFGKPSNFVKSSSSDTHFPLEFLTCTPIANTP